MNFHDKQAFSIKEFCTAFGLGKTSVYKEIKEGRLKTKKPNRRTIITRQAAQEWLSTLPEGN